MIRQISTYGAALLTAMVVVRAATMEEQKDVSNLYQRTADLTYIDDNLALRDGFKTFDASQSNFLASNIRSVSEIPEHKSTPYTPSDSDADLITSNAQANSVEFTEVDAGSVLLPNEEPVLIASESLSLDRESTINNGLSVLFNRERIHPRPSRVALQQ